MAPCDVLRIWNEQHPPVGYVVPSGEMRVCETPRNFIGIELDADYFKIAERRIAEAQQAGKQLAI